MDTMQTVVARVRMLLRRVDDQKLPDEDIQTVLLQCLRTALEKQKLSITKRISQRAEVTLSPTELDNDYIIDLPDAEFEVEKLEYQAFVTENTSGTGEVTLVPLSAWNSHANDSRIVGSIYGGNRIRLNIGECNVSDLTWTLTFRDSLLRAVQLGQKPPIPTNHLPMLEHEAAVLCMPLVNDDSERWINWCSTWLPLYGDKATEEKQLWMDYLNTSDEPQIQPIVRSDRHRRAARTRAVIPAQ